MKWIYGKQDWKTLERGQENCFLMTNYLGGFSSLTMTGSVTRNDHALLMACTYAPNHRYNMLHRMKEEIEIGEEVYCMSTQEFSDGHREKGYEFLSCFTYEDTPAWRFQIKGVEICKEMGMKRGANAISILYEICNRGSKDCRIILTPFFQFVPKGTSYDKNVRFFTEWKEKNISGKEIIEGHIEANDLTLYFRTNGECKRISEEKETYFYSYDKCDGREENGVATANHQICLEVAPFSTGKLELVYEMEHSTDTAEEIISGIKRYRSEISDNCGFTTEIAKTLAKSADQFISKRESTREDTILAGFPFFEDWGRDTMIALTGLCISTERFESAKRILHTFAVNEKNGLMPNLFPEGSNEPAYNTADAALLFINSVYLYYEKTQDTKFVQEVYPVMERIIQGYKNGTEFNIHMDKDGLIIAGKGLAQVTWMDVRVGEILPTPRHGKPVEINAYWYNALRMMEIFADITGHLSDGYKELAEKVRISFVKEFWMEDRGYLKDVISETKADKQMRCNQIWAVSMPFSILDREKEKLIVDKVYEKLYTPYGLRTLEMDDPEFHPYYGGSMYKRDMAYHQGTVWVFPLGAYYLAYLKVNDHSEKAKEIVKDQLEVMESVLREGCIGQLPEIYDGKNPCSSKGCFAQAWSVGEILRVYEVIEK